MNDLGVEVVAGEEAGKILSPEEISMMTGPTGVTEAVEDGAEVRGEATEEEAAEEKEEAAEGSSLQNQQKNWMPKWTHT